MATTPATASISGQAPAGLFGSLPDNVRKALEAQFGVNVSGAMQEANLNRFDEKNTYGSRTWGVDETGRPTATTSLAPWEQQKYQDQSWLELERNKMMGAGGLTDQMKKAYSTGLDFNGIQQLAGQNDLANSRQRVEDGLYKRYTARFDPLFKQQDEEFRTRMANEGVAEGSEKYNRNYQQFQQSRSDAYADAQGRAIEGGAAEQDRLFNQSLTGRQQGISERTYLRDNPYREMSQLMALNQGPRDSQYSAISPIQFDPVDVTGTAGAYAGLDNNLEVTKLQGKNQLANTRLQGQNALSLARFGQSGGGGGGGGLIPLQPTQNAPKSNPWLQIGGAFLGSAAQGFGQAAGQGLFGGKIFG